MKYNVAPLQRFSKTKAACDLRFELNVHLSSDAPAAWVVVVFSRLEQQHAQQGPLIGPFKGSKRML